MWVLTDEAGAIIRTLRRAAGFRDRQGSQHPAAVLRNWPATWLVELRVYPLEIESPPAVKRATQRQLVKVGDKYVDRIVAVEDLPPPVPPMPPPSKSRLKAPKGTTIAALKAETDAWNRGLVRAGVAEDDTRP